MNRERELAKAFVDLSDTYAPEFDPLHLFHRLVHACKGLLQVDAAAVMIADARGSLKTMAATDEGAAFVELLQTQTGHGPCMDCYRTGEAGSYSDITADQARWPRLVAAMTGSGYVSLQTIPVRLRERPLGALTLLGNQSGRLSEDEVHLARSLADSSAVALMHWSTEPARRDDVITRVQSAIAAKATLEVAKGMIAAHAGVAVGEAGHLLTDYAGRHRASLVKTAQALITRDLEPAAIFSVRT